MPPQRLAAGGKQPGDQPWTLPPLRDPAGANDYLSIFSDVRHQEPVFPRFGGPYKMNNFRFGKELRPTAP